MLKNAEKSFLLGKTRHADAVLQKEPEIDEISHMVERFMARIPSDKLNEDERSSLEKL